MEQAGQPWFLHTHMVLAPDYPGASTPSPRPLGHSDLVSTAHTLRAHLLRARSNSMWDPGARPLRLCSAPPRASATDWFSEARAEPGSCVYPGIQAPQPPQ